MAVSASSASVLIVCRFHPFYWSRRPLGRPRHQKGERGQGHASAAFYLRERPGTDCTGDWVGPTAGLDRCGKSRPHRDSIPVQPVASRYTD
jgi:hypothetical protein